MVLTSFPTDQRRGKVKVKITDHTVCKPHGPVFKGDIVEVEYSQFLILKENGKAELVKVEGAPRKPATLEQLVAEVKAAGYSDEAAEAIAQERFDGKHGEASRYLAPQQPVSEQLGGDPQGEAEEVEVDGSVFRAALEKKTKAEIVALAKEEFGLELDEAKKKDELIEAVAAAAVKA